MMKKRFFSSFILIGLIALIPLAPCGIRNAIGTIISDTTHHEISLNKGKAYVTTSCAQETLETKSVVCASAVELSVIVLNEFDFLVKPTLRYVTAVAHWTSYLNFSFHQHLYILFSKLKIPGLLYTI